MLGLVCLAWLYLRKLNLERGGAPSGHTARECGNSVAPGETHALGSDSKSTSPLT
jgi:hypothetical protein